MKFTPADRFFDDLVTYLGSTATLAFGGSAYDRGSARPLAASDGMVIRGRPAVSNVEFEFRPLQVLGPVFSGAWPTEVDIDVRPLAGPVPSSFTKLEGMKRYNAVNIQSAFVHYFETQRPAIEAKHGPDPHSWPSELNFGRVIRNAFAHGGKINFTSTTAARVAWRSLKYGPTDNGTELLHRDLTAVEIIQLMTDMDVQF